MSEPQNTTLDTALKALDVFAYDIIAEGAYTLAVADFPFLGAPVLKQLTKALIKKVIGYIEGPMENYLIVKINKYQSTAEGQAAIESHKKLETTLQTGSTEEIENAKKDFAEKYGKLIRYRRG